MLGAPPLRGKFSRRGGSRCSLGGTTRADPWTRRPFGAYKSPPPMTLRLQCPSCNRPYRLPDPPPAEGKRYRCTCGTVLTVTYPEEYRERLRQAAAEGGASGAAPAPARALRNEAQPPSERIQPPSPSQQQPAPPRPPRPAVDSQAPTSRLAPSPALGAASASRDSAPRPIPGPERAWAPPPMPPPLAPSSPRVPSLTAPPQIPPMGPMSAARPTPAPAAAARAPLAVPGSSGPDGDEDDDERRATDPPRAAPPRPPRPPVRWGFVAKWATTLLAGGALLGALAVAGVLFYYSRDLPSVESLRHYAPPTVTVISDMNGRAIGEFFEEQRYVVPIEAVPEHVQNAFLAAEDASFWEHGGIDYMGMVRAFIRNVTEQRMAQGASTITQQVARSFLLTKEKKLARKIREILLAFRIENNFDKKYILHLYLNQIFLGHGAYGVEAASRLYFGKSVGSLTVPEAALIAGLPQAPSNYSPNKNYDAAKARQAYVLGQMAGRGMITEAQAEEFRNAPLTFVRKRDRNLDHAPYYVEHVRRYLVDTYGHDTVYNQGLQVRVPIDLEVQQAANQAVQDGVRRVDRRLGWRGPILQLTDPAAVRTLLDEIDRERTRALRAYDPSVHIGDGAVDIALVPALTVGEESRAVLEEVHEKWARVAVGQRKAILAVEDFAWCHKVNPLQDFRYFKCSAIDDVLKPGDVVVVRVVAAEHDFSKLFGKDHTGSATFPRLAMSQNPWPEAAILSVRVTDGAVLAVVGGSDYGETEFNRATQAKRQVGSTFKPFVYAAGIDRKERPYTPSTILVDAPIVEEMLPKAGETEPELWKLDNSDGEYLGDTTLRRGLVLSRNAVTVRLAMDLGLRYLSDFYGRFGFDSKLEPNMSTALGTASITLVEMARAYSVFATLGDRRDSYWISEVTDRTGKVLERTDAGALAEDVLSEESAFVMVGLLQDVVRAGTATAALELGVPVAGKTGTTSEFRDAWFCGFTPEVVTAVWVGLDEFKSLGRGMYGADIALPLWIDTMRAALAKYPPSDYPKPPGVVFARVDSKSGQLARDGEKGTAVAFKRGTEPTSFAPDAGAVDTDDFLSGEY